MNDFGEFYSVFSNEAIDKILNNPKIEDLTWIEEKNFFSQIVRC